MQRQNPTRRGWPIREGHDGSNDLAVAALTELIIHERTYARLEERQLVDEADPGCVWLLWFAIGATEAVCDLVGCGDDSERNAVFQQVVGVVFDEQRVRSGASPAFHDKHLIELFQSAGAEAVAACMRSDRKLGYYVEALRVSRLRER